MLLSVLAIAICAGVGAADAAAQVWWVQSADWGSGNRRQDVTNTVRRLADGPNFKVNNNNMGVDPAVGADKTLRIMSANYYSIAGPGSSDVTAQLQGMVRNNRLNIVANIQTLGDPALGRPKKLNVVYQYQGRVNKVTVGENSRLNIP